MTESRGAASVTYYWIGPESKVYHLYRDCRHLRAVGRYWPLDKGRERPRGRYECVTCAKRRFLDA